MSDDLPTGFRLASEFTPDRNEHGTKHDLTEWLKSNSATVYWEESNDWDHPTFSIDRHSDHGRTPDLLIELGGYVFVVEYKTGSSVGEIYDALFQLGGYWVDYIKGDDYRAGGRRKSVDGFLTASSHSPAGRLFPKYAERRQDYSDMDTGRRSCFEYNQLPPAEYRMTEQHIRLLWRYVKDATTEDHATGTETPNIGGLLSDMLQRPSDDPKPAVLWNATPTNQDWEVFD